MLLWKIRFVGWFDPISWKSGVLADDPSIVDVRKNLNINGLTMFAFSGALALDLL